MCCVVLLRLGPEKARDFYQLSLEGFHLLRSRIDKYSIPCDVKVHPEIGAIMEHTLLMYSYAVGCGRVGGVLLQELREGVL